jgi:hypothetical protein
MQEVKPLVDDLIQRLEARPDLIPVLASQLPQTLAGYNLGLKIDDGATFHDERQEGSSGKKDDVQKWREVTCDACNTHSITGIRFKCAVCPDYGNNFSW